MKDRIRRPAIVLAALCAISVSLADAKLAEAAPQVRRLTPPSTLFSIGDPNPPIIARFLPGQRFDLQATVSPDAGQTMVEAEFWVDSQKVHGPVAMTAATVAGLPVGTSIFTRRAYENLRPGVHVLTVKAKQSDGQVATAEGNFQIVALEPDGLSEGHL